MFRHRVKAKQNQELEETSKFAYPFRLNLYVYHFLVSAVSLARCISYDKPPLYEVTLEEFETCALDRLRVLAEIESSFARNRPWDELKGVTDAQCKKHLPLNNNTALMAAREDQRRSDHLGHFVLRLAFCRSWVRCCRMAGCGLISVFRQGRTEEAVCQGGDDAVQGAVRDG